MKVPSIFLSCVIATVVAGSATAADPKPPSRFPMKAADFRKLMDPQLTAFEAQASGCSEASRGKALSLISQCKMAMLSACADGMVTEVEGSHVLDLRDAAMTACVPAHPPPPDDPDDD